MTRGRNTTPRRKHGFCTLTHRPGAFVKSHLLPEALTRSTVQGAPLVQYGEGRRPGQRWTSWYDAELVTRDGEDVLSALDTWAIAALRQHLADIDSNPSSSSQPGPPTLQSPSNAKPSLTI